MSEQEDNQFENLLYYLQQNRGFDFTGYKRPSLMRRVRRRMQIVGVDSFVDYLDYLEVHPEEFSQLFNTILINVTSFYRDPAAWDYLGKEIIHRILQKKQPDESIRVWSAGCASGEEAYTAAMVLSEAMGIEIFRRKVKIYATDVDEEALNIARQASYAAKDLEEIDSNLRSTVQGFLLEQIHRTQTILRHRSVNVARKDPSKPPPDEDEPKPPMKERSVKGPPPTNR